MARAMPIWEPTSSTKVSPGSCVASASLVPNDDDCEYIHSRFTTIHQSELCCSGYIASTIAPSKCPLENDGLTDKVFEKHVTSQRPEDYSCISQQPGARKYTLYSTPLEKRRLNSWPKRKSKPIRDTRMLYIIRLTTTPSGLYDYVWPVARHNGISVDTITFATMLITSRLRWRQRSRNTIGGPPWLQIVRHNTTTVIYANGPSIVQLSLTTTCSVC